MNTAIIEELKQSAIDFQNWIDNGFEELDETDIYPSDLFHAVATPKNILGLIRHLDLIKSQIEESNMYQEAILKKLHDKLGVDYSDGELRFKWVSMALTDKLRELESLKSRIDGGVRMYAIGKNASIPADGYGHIANSTLIIDNGVYL